MTLLVGRCNVLAEPERVSMSGDVLEFRAQMVVTSLAGYQAACGQLRGLVGNRDENAFPVTSAADPSLDGFYTDFDVSIDPVNGANGLYTLPWVTVRCRRVGASVTPRIEIVAQSFVRTNSHAVSPGTALFNAIPTPISGSVVESDIGFVFTGGGPVATANAPDTGVITLFTAAPQATIKAGRYSVRQTPADRYDGSAVIEYSYDNGSTHTPLVGTQLPPQLINNSYYRWRIGNGLFRIGPNTAGLAGFRLGTYNGGSWEDTDMVLIHGTSDFPYQEGTPAVLANSPNRCTLSLAYGDITATVSVVRGLRLAFFTFSAVSTCQWGARSETASAATAITGGLRRTSNDANGNRWVVCVPVAATSDLVNGLHYYTTGTTSGAIGVGVEHNGSTATGQDTATALRDSFYLPALSDERVVTR